MTPFTFSFRRHSNQKETILAAGREFRFDIDEYVAQGKGRGISWTNLVATSDNVMEGATHATA